MEGEYQIGALCEFIAAKSVNKKTRNVTADSNNIDSSCNKEIENEKKRKSKKSSSINIKKLKKNKEIPIEQQSSSLNIKQDLPLIEPSENPQKNVSNNLLINIRKKKKLDKIKKTCTKESEDYIEKESRTIFVGNVPVNVKMTSIKALFKQFGDIETTRLRSVAVKNLNVPKRVSIMKGDFHPLRDTANVYIRFKTIEQAQKALVLNATQFDGHKIRVDMAMNSNHKQNKKKGIFIGNLPYNIQEDEVWNFFNDCGVITSVRIVRDNMTGVSKGFGYVDFEKPKPTKTELMRRKIAKKLAV
ncbi:RNA-binding protein 34 isoform X2 [Daktulosphaira vitifoliae]|uniref:RNA-binding protein 34 isoform X2 n=1 Tax=Daktulosphaira vitifoliae TaxID=58002 RepID=UPI0021AA8E1E|nr:RNA-binding protein 34 isoform X2 [Daktulosphaira vitifoliae]